MNDMSAVIVPKSDQTNTDDLLAGPRTITIREVTIRPGTEQPVSIHYEGDNGKPWKPCKSMSRVLVAAWGPDANKYVGRSATLYGDPKVKWGGMQVGGIRVSHLSHIEREMMMALTETKGKRAPFVVKPLANAPAPKTANGGDQAAGNTETKSPEMPFAILDAEGTEHMYAKGSEYLKAMETLFDEATDALGFWDSNSEHFTGWQTKLLQKAEREGATTADKKASEAFNALGKRIMDRLAGATATPDDAPVVTALPIPQRPEGGPDWPAFFATASEHIRQAPSAEYIAAWVAANADSIRALGTAKKTWPSELEHVGKLRVAELGQEGGGK